MGMKKDYILPNIKEARRRNNTEEIARLTYNVDEKYLNLGKDKKYLIKTHGCQANFRFRDYCGSFGRTWFYRNNK